ncbi:MAG: glycosyltransferase family 2 protein [Candidatus Gracilibacteria bacterium]
MGKAILTPKVSIIILNYNGIKDTLECLDSLKKCDYPNFEIVLVDNGSENSQVETLEKIKMDGCRLILNSRNLGFAGGNNVAIKEILNKGDSEYIYFLNNDTVVESDFLAKAVEIAENDRLIGIVASLSLQYFNRGVVENAGHDFLNCGDFVPRRRGALKSKFNKVEDVLGACSAGALYRTKILVECGFYDESFFLNYEDADLSMRCILYGWKCVLQPQSVIYHKVNVSIKKVRDYSFNLRSQQNLLKAYWYNTPFLVLVFNFLFFILRDVAVVLVNVVFLHFEIAKVFVHARVRFFANFREVLIERSKRMKYKKVSSWYILKKQKFFLYVYLQYFWKIIVSNERSVLETK